MRRLITFCRNSGNGALQKPRLGLNGQQKQLRQRISFTKRLGMEETRRKMGSKLREAREYLELTQQEVAQVLGLPRSAISLIETGERRLETLELKQLAELYGRPISDFTEERTLEQAPEIRMLMRKAEAMSEQDRKEIVRFADWLLGRGRREMNK